MIYLIGVDHQVQHRKDLHISKIFSFYLKRKAEQLRAKLIAEEWHEELLKENGIKSTIPQDVAQRLETDHIFCDPNKEERLQMGWKTKADDNKREIFWLEKIKNKANENVIFICGADHLGTFSKLIRKLGYRVQTLSKRFDVISYLQSENKDLFD